MPPSATAKTGISPVLVNPAMPKDPHLRAVADDVLAKLKYCFSAVAAENRPTATGGLDRVFRSYLASRTAPARKRYRERARALLASPAPSQTREFRRYAAIAPQEYPKLGSDGMVKRVGKLAVKGEGVKLGLKQITKAISALPPGHTFTPADPDLRAGRAFKKMRLFVRRVRCLEETDEVGSDEINMGGTATDPFGTTTLVPEFVVSDDFDEGEQVDFGMSKVFHTWDIATKSDGFPYVYAAVIALGEKDDGGFWEFLQQLWAKVESDVTSLISTAIGAAVGAAIGAAFAGIGAIIGAIIGAFIGWILSLLGENADDPVGVAVLLVTLVAATKSYYDALGLTSPDGWPATLGFTGDGGHYEVDLACRVFTS